LVLFFSGRAVAATTGKGFAGGCREKRLKRSFELETDRDGKPARVVQRAPRD